jgi:anaerobic dimethyl sulfoxide reductase subunit C (anchor subunit)
MAEAKTREWPLIVFTVGLQLAAGIELSTVLSFWPGARTTVFLGTLAISVFPIIAVAIVASLFHLGKPQAAWRAFTNIGRSKLSREVVICSIFCVLAFAQFTACLAYSSAPQPLMLICTVAGIASVVASARIYIVPAQVLWNSGWVTSSFVGATLLLGGVVTNIVDGSYKSSLMIETGAVVFLASSVAMVGDILRISKRKYASPESVPMLQTKHWLGLCGLVVGTVVPILGLAVNHTSGRLAAATTIIAVVGVVLGRALMYSRGIALTRF